VDGYKREFIDFMIESDVLTFGDFTTKSGRKTPYFVQTGKYRTGAQIRRLGEFYADAIEANFGDFDVLFGPAYKGIPLAVETAGALAARGRDVGFMFNRKEAKDHGEGGVIVSVDRMERGTGDKAALAQVGDEFAMPTHAIVTVEEIIEHADLSDEMVERMHAYLAEYGARS